MESLLTVTAGETLRITIDAPLSTIAASVYIRGPKNVNVTATFVSGKTWTASQSTTNWPAGEYQWEAWTTIEGGERIVHSRGILHVLSSLESIQGDASGDLRSDAKKALDAIDAMLAGRATDGVRGYQINNRRLDRYSVAELLRLRSHFLAKVRAERAATDATAENFGQRIQFRF